MTSPPRNVFSASCRPSRPYVSSVFLADSPEWATRDMNSAPLAWALFKPSFGKWRWIERCRPPRAGALKSCDRYPPLVATSLSVVPGFQIYNVLCSYVVGHCRTCSLANPETECQSHLEFVNRCFRHDQNISNDVHILSTDIQCFLLRINELELLLKLHRPHMMMMQETWLMYHTNQLPFQAICKESENRYRILILLRDDFNCWFLSDIATRINVMIISCVWNWSRILLQICEGLSLLITKKSQICMGRFVLMIRIFWNCLCGRLERASS